MISKYKKQIKIVVILCVIAVILEGLLFGYKLVINKAFEKLHLVGNTTIEIGIDQIGIDETKDKDYTYLTVDKPIKEVNNISLKLKQKNQDVYIRVVGMMDKLMQKTDENHDTFRAYLTKPTNFEKIEIAYAKTQIDKENIEKIIINDNVDYVAKAEISMGEFFILLSILLVGYIIIEFYQWMTKKEQKIEIEKLFLILSLLMGTILTFISAPLAKYDEHAHFWRTYEIAIGNIVSDIRNEMPISVAMMAMGENKQTNVPEINYQTTKEKFNYDLNPEEKMPLPVGATAGNSPFSYLPPLVGTFLGNLLKLKPIITIYLGRLCNVVAYSLLLYFAIKLMPKNKWKQIIAIIGLFPMCLNLASSYSPDTTIISVAIFMLSYTMHLKFGERNIKWKDPVILGIATFILAICKIVYFPMLLLFFLLPKEKFKNTKTRILYLAIMIGVFVGAMGLWNLIPKGSAEITIRGSATEQFFYAISDPMRTAEALTNTILTQAQHFNKRRRLLLIANGRRMEYPYNLFINPFCLNGYCHFTKRRRQNRIRKERQNNIRSNFTIRNGADIYWILRFLDKSSLWNSRRNSRKIFSTDIATNSAFGF